jgi:hypothetical protein
VRKARVAVDGGGVGSDDIAPESVDAFENGG